MATIIRCPECGADPSGSDSSGPCPACSKPFGVVPPEVEPAATVDFVPGVLETIAGTIGPVPRVQLRDTEPGAPTESVASPADPGGRYRIDGEIAHGGMGVILKGRDPDLGRDVALKVLRDEFRTDPNVTRRFVEEAQIGGQLQHPGIVPIYELGTLRDRRLFFSMKLVKGHTLDGLLKARAGPDDELSRFLGIFEQIAQTVAYAHTRGVIHRDLKPLNVMVGSFGEVQVMDWGLAKVLSRGEAQDTADPHATVIETTRSASDAQLSRAGSALGTPAYMAPEQARGELDQIDERADVFALGSILCEVLTGKPAFTGRSGGEIQRKAARGELAEALARLEASGAEAELIALSRDCLAPERDDRPRDALAVAGRITAYLASVQERARQAERDRAVAEAKAIEERRRRKLQLSLGAALLALTIGFGLGMSYLIQQRAARASALDRRLDEVTDLIAQAKERPEDVAAWERAVDAATRAAEGMADDPATSSRLGPLAEEARDGLKDVRRIAALRQALVDVRAAQKDVGDAGTDLAYAAAFRDAELDLDALEPDEFDRRLWKRSEAVVVEVAAFLDDWSHFRRRANRPTDVRIKPILAAFIADPDPYRGRLRWALIPDDLRREAETIKTLAAAPEAADLPAPTAVLLARSLKEIGSGEEAIALLHKAAIRYPDDVWINFDLAEALSEAPTPAREEAVRYYTAARAVRPETAHPLAHLLVEMGRKDEAEAVFRELVRRQPDDPLHTECLGIFLKEGGRVAEGEAFLARAIDFNREEIRLKSGSVEAHLSLGLNLNRQGRHKEAEATYRKAIRLKPDSAMAHFLLGLTLHAQDCFKDAETSYREAIRLRPDLAEIHSELGEVLGAQGRPEEAETSYREAIRLKPDYALAHCNLGHILQESGRYCESLSELRIGHRLGSGNKDWTEPSSQWVAEAEHMVAFEGRLAAILAGRDRPEDQAERIALALMCDTQGRHQAAAHLRGEALAADPALADDREAQHRYHAACSAVLAASGHGRHPSPGDELRSSLRDRALGWLKAEHATWSEHLNADRNERGAQVIEVMEHWRSDPDLASVRDPASLAGLLESEQQAWRSLWASVTALIRTARTRS